MFNSSSTMLLGNLLLISLCLIFLKFVGEDSRLTLEISFFYDGSFITEEAFTMETEGASIIYSYADSYRKNHNDMIRKTREDFICNVCVWEGVGDRTELQYIDPHSYGHQHCVFLILLMLNRRPGGPLCWLSLLHLITNWSGPQSPSGVLKAPSAGWWLSLPHLVSNSSDLQLTDFLSSPSYIIVQSPTQSSPTQSLEWHVWSSSSRNNCLAVQRSLSSGASVYECIMGFYLVPFHQPNLPTRFLLITGHWNLSLPSGASLWNGMFGRVKGQYTTQGLMLVGSFLCRSSKFGNIVCLYYDTRKWYLLLILSSSVKLRMELFWKVSYIIISLVLLVRRSMLSVYLK